MEEVIKGNKSTKQFERQIAICSHSKVTTKK